MIESAPGRVISVAQCRAEGLTRDEIRARYDAGDWQRMAHGVYLADAAVLDEAAVERAEIVAALLALGPDAVAVHETAAELHGLAGLPRGPRRIHVSIPPGSARAHRGDIRIHECVFGSDHVTEVDGVPVTTPHRTVADILRRLGRSHAVSVADSALHKGLISVGDLERVRMMMYRRRGAARARERLLLVDGRSASPLETRTRLICVDGGVPPDELQYPIRDRFGALVALGDLVWTRKRVVAEADGAGPHGEPEALFRDRRRQNDLTSAGWTVLRFTWADTLRPGYVLSAVRRALAGAGPEESPRF